MNKVIWEKGVPEVPGFYWLRFDFGNKFIELRPLVLQIRNNTTYAFGPYGGGPLDMMFHNKTVANRSYHAPIPHPKKWQTLDKIEGQENYCWVKHPEGYTGFAILNEASHNNVYGDWYWIDHPTLASDHIQYIDNDKGYLFSLVQPPMDK